MMKYFSLTFMLFHFQSEWVQGFDLCCPPYVGSMEESTVCTDSCECCPRLGVWVGDIGDGLSYPCGNVCGDELIQCPGECGVQCGSSYTSHITCSNPKILAHLKVEDGEFKDVCNKISIRSGTNDDFLSSGVISAENALHIQNGKFVYFNTPMVLDYNRFAIAIQGYKVNVNTAIDIIIGPATTNNQIRYEAGNTIGVYAYYVSPAFHYPNIDVQFPTNKMNTIIVYYNYGKLHIYQSNKLQKTITGHYAIDFNRIGIWNGGKFPANIVVKNVAISKEMSLRDFQSFVGANFYNDVAQP